MSIYDEADRFLEAFKLNSVDPVNNDIALRIVKKYGGLEKSLMEIVKDKYNRFRFTPEILLRAMLDESDDLENNLAQELSLKLYALRSSIFQESLITGRDFDQEIEKVNIIDSLKLSLREAWTVYYLGGREFILNMNRLRDGDSVVEKIRSAIVMADQHLDSHSENTMGSQSKALLGYNKP